MADNSLTPKEEFLLNPVTEHNITDAAIASFETNLRHPLKVEVPFEPVQDLHGYDRPWPGGGSKNLVDINSGTSSWDHITVANGVITSNPASGAGSTHYISYTVNDLTVGGSYYLSVNVLSNKTGDRISILLDNGGTGSAQTNYGSTGFIDFTFEATDTTVVFRIRQAANGSWTANQLQLEVGTARTAFVPYENICSISGWTGCNAISTGKNLLDYNKLFESGHAGTDWWDYYDWKVPAGTYKLSTNFGGTSTSDAAFALTYIGGPTSGGSINIYPGHSVQYTFTKSTTLRVHRRKKGGSYVPTLSQFRNGTIELLLTRNVQDTIYEPFGTTIPIAFTDPSTGDPMTIYGGTVTLNEDGSADVVSTYVTYNIQPSQWTWMASSHCFKIDRTSLSPRYKVFGSNADSRVVDIASNKYKPNTFNNMANGYGSPNYSVGIREYNARWLALRTDGTNSVLPEECQIKLPLATPQTYHFPNVGQLKAFLGVNNVWSDIGNVNVKYLTQNSETGMEYRGDRALELRRRAMIADAPTIHTTVGSSETNGLASFKSYIKAPVKKIEIPFSPKQDLHGMPNPYPAGTSVNLIPDTTDTNNGYIAGYYLKSDGSTVADANMYISEYIELDSATTYTWSNRINTATIFSICFYDENKTFISGIAINSQYYHTFTPPEGAVYCRSSQTTYAWQEAASTHSAYQLEVGSTATPYQRYSNICPIEGFGHANTENRSKNFFDFSKWDTVAKINKARGSAYHAVDVPVSDGVYTVHSKYFNDYNAHGFYANIAGDYGHSASSSPSAISYWMHHNTSLAYRHNTVVIRVTGGHLYINIYQANANTITWLSGLQVEAGSVVTDYVPYREPDSIPITFTDPTTGDPMTIYGGTVTLNQDGSADVVSGYNLIENPTCTIRRDISSEYAVARVTYSASVYNFIGSISNKFRYVVGTVNHAIGTYWVASFGVLFFAFSPSLTDTEIKAEMTNVQFLVHNITPRSYHFDNIGQLKTFLGENNFWCDISDDITVKYWNRGFGN